MQKARDLLSRLRGQVRVSARDLAKATGHILSMSLVLGPVARLWMRAMYALIDQRWSWSSCLVVAENVCAEITFWSEFLVGPVNWKLWSVQPCTLAV